MEPEGAKHLIKIEHCGSWGFGGIALDAISQIEKYFGAGKFAFHIYRDHGKTGRLEFTLYPDSLKEEGKGILIHSKKLTGKLI